VETANSTLDEWSGIFITIKNKAVIGKRECVKLLKLLRVDCILATEQEWDFYNEENWGAMIGHIDQIIHYVKLKTSSGDENDNTTET